MLGQFVRMSYDWYLVHKGPLELLGLLLAVVGTIFAVLSIRDGRNLTRDLRAVFDHLTTKAIGPFPAYMAEVERLISEARESIFIACDFPGYGAWTDRGRYGSYVKALENRKADLVRRGRPFNIQILCLDARGRAKSLEDRLPEQRWKDYVRKGGFAKSRRLYEELENCTVPEARPQFLAEMLSRQNRAIEADLRFADRWEYSALMPIYFWIADAEKAVFAIPSFGDDLGEFGFYTEEAGLVQALLSIWAHYLDASIRVKESSSAPALVKAAR